MQVVNPTLVGPILHKSSVDAQPEPVSLHDHENSDTLASLGEDSSGRLTFKGVAIGAIEHIAFNLDGVITEAASGLTIAMENMKFPKGFVGSRAVCKTPPSASVSIPVKVDGTVVGSVSIAAVTGVCSFSGPTSDVQLSAGSELSLTFDALANTGCGNVAVVLTAVKDA